MIRVVAGVLVRDGRALLCQRPAGKDHESHVVTVESLNQGCIVLLPIAEQFVAQVMAGYAMGLCPFKAEGCCPVADDADNLAIDSPCRTVIEYCLQVGAAA